MKITETFLKRKRLILAEQEKVTANKSSRKGPMPVSREFLN